MNHHAQSEGVLMVATGPRHRQECDIGKAVAELGIDVVDASGAL